MALRAGKLVGSADFVLRSGLAFVFSSRKADCGFRAAKRPRICSCQSREVLNLEAKWTADSRSEAASRVVLVSRERTGDCARRGCSRMSFLSVTRPT